MTSVTPLRFSHRVRALAPLILLLVATAPAGAALRPASPFGDHMVLQRDMPVPVWGWADPGATITVEFAGQAKTTTVDADGNWRVTLDPLAATGESRELIVYADRPQAPRETRQFSDVLVGEVWLCGGQSNMERELGLRDGQKPIVGWEEAVATANFPLIRQFYVPQHTAEAAQPTTPGEWTVCTPATAPNFTAVGFFFARALHQARDGVPIGIIHSSWGGTPAEAWTSEAGLRDFPEFAAALRQARDAARDPAGAQQRFLDQLNAWFAAHDPGTRERAWEPGRDTTTWTTVPAPGLWEDAGHENWDGIAWYHRTFDLPAAWAGHELTLNLAAVDDIDTTWVNGVEVGTTTWYSTQRTYRVPASALRPGRNEITVRVLDTGGGGGIWNARRQLDLAPTDLDVAPLSLAGPWQVRFTAVLGNLPPPPPNVMTGGPGVPTVLYNAMLAPLVGYAIRGVTFYQGEANAPRATQYRKLLPALIADWRRAWNQGEFPFLFVQIAPYEGQPPEIREAQLLAWQATKNTAMVVTIDVGDAEDIHPAEKRPVGERLALAARALAYGENIPYSGPVYESLHVDGAKAVLRFTHVAGGLVARDGPLFGFTIAGADGVFHEAQAEIVDDTVVVSAPGVAQPVAVRYGWANVAAGNLFNAAGLPASPFRTNAP